MTAADRAAPLGLRPKNPMTRVLLSICAFEVIAFGLALPVMLLVSKVPLATAVTACAGAVLLALVAAALLRRPIGFVFGWLTQLVGLALGLLTPGMYVVGAMFLGIWVLTFVLGRRLDTQAPTT